MDIPTLISKQKDYYNSGATLDVGFRREMLHKLRDALRCAEPKLFRALNADLGKTESEAYLSEIGVTLAELRHAIRSLPKWAKPKRARTPLVLIGASGFIVPEPYGSALIIAPWNFPVFLSLPPLIGAIAAGNCAVLKPSELAPHTSQALRELIAGTFPEEYVAVVEGEADVSQALLREHFDYIFFTGSTAVGRKVMEAAASNLTPVTLELGGKSPCLVHGDANIALAARRIAWGKTLNAGQTCVAPDYVLVQRSAKERFVAALRAELRLQAGDALSGGRFARIVSERHCRRLVGLLDGQPIVYGGRYDTERRLLEPTLLDEPDPAAPVMQEEIFGPILPILAYDKLEDALRFVRERPKPLALYVFTESAQVERETLRRVPFGGGCVNDTVLHLSSPYLPFGGVGSSGMGGYHGRASFDTFSHHKSVLRQTTRFDLPFRYAAGDRMLTLMRRILK